VTHQKSTKNITTCQGETQKKIKKQRWQRFYDHGHDEIYHTKPETISGPQT